MSTWAAPIRVTRTTLTLVPDRPWQPSPETAVRLRGMLGLMFTRAACTRPPRDCAPCDLRAACVVPTWFEPNVTGGHQARPYRVSFPDGLAAVTPNHPLRVDLHWFGAVPRPDLLVRALLELPTADLGPAAHRLDRVEARGAGDPVDVVLDSTPVAPWPAPASLASTLRPLNGPLRVRLRSPLQLDAPPVHTAPNPAHLLRKAIRRVQEVATAQGVRLDHRWPDVPEHLGQWCYVRVVPAARWTRRQQAWVDLSGVIGEIVYPPEVAPWADLLAAAAIVGLGRHTTCGLGDLQIEPA